MITGSLELESENSIVVKFLAPINYVSWEFLLGSDLGEGVVVDEVEGS